MTDNNIQKATQEDYLMQGAAMGIPESLIRYSTGIEDVGDLMTDLDQALKAL